MNRIVEASGEIPTLTTEQMIEVDRLMIEEFHIELIQMMENAGRCLAIVAMEEFLAKAGASRGVLVLAGTGGNGGGAMVCARRLHNWGVSVSLVLSKPADQLTPIPAHQMTILRQMGIPVFSADQLAQLPAYDLIIDGVIGYSIKGSPRGAAKEIIEWANQQLAPILALDTPSGLDLTSGRVHEPTIRAAATLTLALPKKGLFFSTARAYRGTLYLGDISVPPSLYQTPGLALAVSAELFAAGDVLRLSS